MNYSVSGGGSFHLFNLLGDHLLKRREVIIESGLTTQTNITQSLAQVFEPGGFFQI